MPALRIKAINSYNEYGINSAIMFGLLLIKE
jgi:hypothetical protein